MNQISRTRTVPLAVYPRILGGVVRLALACTGLIVVLAFRRDIEIIASHGVWWAVACTLSLAVAWSAWKLIRRDALLTADASGLWFRRLLSEPVPWTDIRRIEALTEPGRLGERHDHLVISFKHPRKLPWRGARGRSRDGRLPQAALSVRIGASWPHRALDLHQRLRETAGQALVASTPEALSRPARWPMLATLAASLLVPVTAYVADVSLPRFFAKGLAYADAGRIGDALPYLERDARAGDRESARMLGEIYRNGDGVERNLPLSTAWYVKGAERGDTWSAFRLGEAYRLGLGVPQNTVAAMRWLEMAARNDIAAAAFALGDIYRTGQGVRRDYAKAVAYLTDAADLGFAAAAHDLGRLHHDGIGLPFDAIKAEGWYKRAIDGGHVPAVYDLARLKLHGEMPDRTRGFQLMIDAADRGHAPAQRDLARLHLQSADLQGIETAYLYLSLAARQWPAETRADVIRERVLVGQSLDPEALERAKARVRAWRPTGR